MLDIEELLEIEEQVRDMLNDRLEEVLIKLNRDEQLEEFLSLINMNELINEKNNRFSAQNGKIIVVGQSEVEKEKLAAVAKNLGIDRGRFEFFLSYEDAKKFDFKKTQWTDKYSCILVGQMPHSGYAKEDYGSVISALENMEGYPIVVRVGTNGLKITKTSFRNTLLYLLNNKIIEQNELLQKCIA